MTASPTLIVLRGNSGSGKSSVARELRAQYGYEQYGYGLAWVEQDYLRRILLREHDIAGGKNIALIELNVHYALGAGYHVVLEGILNAGRYGAMLERLYAEFGGHWFYFDLPFEETLRRHQTRPLADVVDARTLQSWYVERDLLPFVQEDIIPPESSLDRTVARILAATGLKPATS